MGASKNLGPLFASSYNEGYEILGSNLMTKFRLISVCRVRNTVIGVAKSP